MNCRAIYSTLDSARQLFDNPSALWIKKKLDTSKLRNYSAIISALANALQLFWRREIHLRLNAYYNANNLCALTLKWRGVGNIILCAREVHKDEWQRHFLSLICGAFKLSKFSSISFGALFLLTPSVDFDKIQDSTSQCYRQTHVKRTSKYTNGVRRN